MLTGDGREVAVQLLSAHDGVMSEDEGGDLRDHGGSLGLGLALRQMR